MIKAKKTYIDGRKRDRENEEIITDININTLVGTIVLFFANEKSVGKNSFILLINEIVRQSLK